MKQIQKYIFLKTIKTKSNSHKTILAIDENTNEKVIIKQYFNNNNFSLISYKRDKNIKIENRTINRYIEDFEHDNSWYVVRQFIEGQNINEITSKVKKKNKLEFVLEYILKVGECLKILHSNGIIHRDIRQSNLMVDKSGNYILIDFSSCYIPELTEIDTFKTFSLIYSPPEQILNVQKYINFSSDLYALGISMWIILTGEIPFQHKIPEIIANLQINLPLPKIKNIPNSLQNIIEKCTYKVPFKKPPSFLDYKEIENIIKQGQQIRYKSIEEMMSDLINV